MEIDIMGSWWYWCDPCNTKHKYLMCHKKADEEIKHLRAEVERLQWENRALSNIRDNYTKLDEATIAMFALTGTKERIDKFGEALGKIAHDHGKIASFQGDWHKAFNWAQDLAKDALIGGE